MRFFCLGAKIFAFCTRNGLGCHLVTHRAAEGCQSHPQKTAGHTSSARFTGTGYIIRSLHQTRETAQPNNKNTTSRKYFKIKINKRD